MWKKDTEITILARPKNGYLPTAHREICILYICFNPQVAFGRDIELKIG